MDLQNIVNDVCVAQKINPENQPLYKLLDALDAQPANEEFAWAARLVRSLLGRSADVTESTFINPGLKSAETSTMISFASCRGKLIQHIAELPSIPKDRIEFLYFDTETASDNSREVSLNPWHNCRVIGFAFSLRYVADVYFVPLQLPGAMEYLNALLRATDTLVGHNPNYDLHACEDSGACIPDALQVNDTIIGCKLLNSDLQYSGGYGLTNCARVFLEQDILPFEQALQPYLGRANKDYGKIPLDILSEYCCVDVATTRDLHAHIGLNMPDQCSRVYATENRLTRILFDMQREGLATRKRDLQIAELKTMHRMLQIEEALFKSVGRIFRPHTNEDCFEILCGQYGLPVVEWTDAGKPSFDKAALASYSAHPFAPKDIVALISEYRKLNTTQNFFITPYQELAVNEILHCSYNQCVRTARMSCGTPNMQQLSTAAKALIVPREGCSFVNVDFSQIEFRIIVHYLNNQAAIDAYNLDSQTDFHDLTARLVGISRKAAKTLNFAVGFGAGKAKTTAMLAANADIISEIGSVENKNVFNHLCRQRGEQVYADYHERFPELKKVSQHVAAVCRERGYVFNLFGRRRHIPARFAHIAFNSAVQSTAADIMKDRAVALADLIRETEIKLLATVHDSYLLEMPTDQVESNLESIMRCVETECIPLRVPIRAQYGTSAINWADADREPKYYSYKRENENEKTF